MEREETLEEAAEKESKYLSDWEDKQTWIDGFVEGAKWQQEQDSNKYNDEEIRFIKGMISLYWMDNNSEHPLNFKEVELSKSIIEKLG